MSWRHSHDAQGFEGGGDGGEAMAPHHAVSAKKVKALQNTKKKKSSFEGTVNYWRIFRFRWWDLKPNHREKRRMSVYKQCR